MAVAHRPDHLQVEARPLLDALRFQQLAVALERGNPRVQFGLNAADRTVVPVRRNQVVCVGVDRDLGQAAQRPAGQRIDLVDGVHLVAEEFDAQALVLRRRRKNLDDVPPHAKRPAVKIQVVALVLDLDELLQDRLAPDLHTLFQVQQHVVVHLGRAETVDARDRGHDDDVVPLEQRPRGRVPHPIDRIVDRGVLGNVGVGGGDVGLRLVVIVVADEVLHRVLGEEALELAIELGRQGLVVDHDQRGLLDALDHVRERKCLAGTGHAQQHLVRQPPAQAVHKRLDGLRLIPRRLKV